MSALTKKFCIFPLPALQKISGASLQQLGLKDVFPSKMSFKKCNKIDRFQLSRIFGKISRYPDNPYKQPNKIKNAAFCLAWV